jgi:adenylosuccinate synthase
MSNLVIVGMQWGDEGKGKIVDLLCPAFDAVVRYQGGNNAGHTVKFEDRHFALHLVPSGILHDGMSCVLGNGMVIHPGALFEELEGLREMGIEPEGRMFISDRAHVLLPGHMARDKQLEEARGDDKIGTTARGIGPAYQSRVARVGLRMADLWAEDLTHRIEGLLEMLGQSDSLDETLAACMEWREVLEPLLRNTTYLLDGWMEEGRSLLFEGAQGALLDIDHGTYPYVTSSSSTTGGAATGSGVAPSKLHGAIGILKAYTSRVGEGPFPTELFDDRGEYIRERGTEYGTTTGRPRRCGWLDLVAANYARRVNGIDSIALTKLDVLDHEVDVPVCVAYRIDGEETTEFPSDLARLARAEPVYETLPGWQANTVGLVDFDQFPEAARSYIAFIEERLGVPASLVSTGPRREETCIRRDPVLARLTNGHLGTA